jgi:hypothetical protein
MFLAEKTYEQDNKIQKAIVRLGQKSGGWLRMGCIGGGEKRCVRENNENHMIAS